MKHLPLGWTPATLGDITTDCTQRTPRSDETFSYIDIASVDRDTKRIVSPQTLSGADAPSRARKVVETGDVLVSMTRPNLNAVAIVPVDLDQQIASTGFDVLRAREVDPRWVFYLVRSKPFVDEMTARVQGALYPAVRSKDVRAFPVPVAPLKEQSRIAGKLDAILARVDTCRERLDRVPGILKRFRQAVLAAATSGELTREWREERGLEESWTRTTVGDVASHVFDGPFGSHLKSKDYVDEGVRVVRLENIAALRFVEEKRTYVTKAKHKSLAKHTLLADDILFSSFVDEEVRVCLLPQHLGGRAINKADCFCVRTSVELCRPHFLVLRLASTSTFQALEDVVHGATRPRINLRQLKAITFALPSLEEQEEIIRRSTALLDLANTLEERIDILHCHLARAAPALLAKAFRGDLLPQSPFDEPASELVARARRPPAQSSDAGAALRGRVRQPRTKSRRAASTLTHTGVPHALLSSILKERGPLVAEALWVASRLEIDEFYEQLKDEEARGLLREVVEDSSNALRMLEAAS